MIKVYYPERLGDDFLELNEPDVITLSGSVVEFLFFVNKNEINFVEYFSSKYSDMDFDTAIFQYYINEVIKPIEVIQIIDNNIETMGSIHEFIMDFNKKIKKFFSERILEIDKVEKIEKLLIDYSFVKEVVAIQNYIDKHYNRLEQISEDYKDRIIRKIQSVIYKVDIEKILLH